VIAGLVLAAGAGTRFGSDSKLLAELDGRPLLDYAIRAQCDVPEIERVVVVLGSRAAEIADRCWFGHAEPVVCSDWADGQSASLRCGVRALAGASKVIVTLGDGPLMTPALIRRFLDQPGGTRAVYHGRPGHPVVLGPEQIDALDGLHGDRGACGLLRGATAIECAELLGSDRDVDTPADLEAVRRETRAIV
jgi:CTP:molybdopterin cytidylyltransferase MocA